MIIAHRGSRLLWPENTITAFEGAASHGVSFFETDVRVSADGVLHCFHDSLLERTTDGRGPINEVSADELALLDAGYRHRLDDGFPFRGRGITVPTFASLLDRFPKAGFVVDLKADGTEEPLAKLIHERQLEGHLIVGSFSGARVNRFRKLCHRRIATSTGPSETLQAIVSGLLGGGLDPFGHSTAALGVPVSWYGLPIVTADLVAVARRFEKLVHVWTINEAAEMKRLINLGVDAIITDRPDVAASVI